MAVLPKSGIKAPQIITDVSISLDGKGFLGSSSAVTLPVIEKEVEEQQIGLSFLHVDKGLFKALKLSFTIERYSAVGLKWAMIQPMDEEKMILMRSSIKDQERQIPVLATFRGIMTKTEEPSFTKQQKVERKFEMGVNYYSLTIDGRVYYLFDAQNMIVSIDGVDQQETLREHLLG